MQTRSKRACKSPLFTKEQNLFTEEECRESHAAEASTTHKEERASFLEQINELGHGVGRLELSIAHLGNESPGWRQLAQGCLSDLGALPTCILELVAEKVNSGEDKDMASFRLVCKQFRDLDKIQKPPWLMLPPKKGSPLRGFYSISGTRIHQLPSRASIGEKCYSSRGWLFTIGSDWGMNLLHPLLDRFNSFKLPGIESFGESRLKFHKLLSKPYAGFIHRVTLSADPSLTSNFVLVVIQGYPFMPAYWRPGDERWTMIETTEMGYADALFYREKCYFITFVGKVFVADFEISNPRAKFITEFSKDLIQVDFSEAIYLVILEGSLLVVSRLGSGYRFQEDEEYREKPYQTINFQVSRLNFKNLSWEELKGLGNWSIFVGHNSSIALNAMVVKGCKPNSIYFTDDNFILSDATWKGAGFDMGIFNMADKTIEPIIEGEWRSHISPPIFVDRLC